MLENLNEDSWVFSVFKAFLHESICLCHGQPLIKFSELLRKSPEILTAEVINIGPVEAKDKWRVWNRRGSGLYLFFSRSTLYPPLVPKQDRKK